MGLAGRKQKQRIPADPRNLSWADDASRFGLAYLSKFGWDSSKGLGPSRDGMKTHLKVQQKLDMMGIGAQHQLDPNGIAWKQNKDFEALLKRLNECVEQGKRAESQDAETEGRSAMDDAFVRAVEEERAEENLEKGSSVTKKKRKRECGGGPDDSGAHARKKEKKERKEKKKNFQKSNAEDSAEPVIDPPSEPPSALSESDPYTESIPKSRPMAHRARIRAAKRIAGKSASAIAEILGIAPSSAVSSSTSTPAPTPPSRSSPAPQPPLSLENLTTSTKSVADYLKEKLLTRPSSSSSPALSSASSASATSGLGATRRKSGLSSHADEDELPRRGIGSRTAVIPPFLQVPEAGSSSTDCGSNADEVTERERRKAERKVEKRKRREAEVAEVSTVDLSTAVKERLEEVDMSQRLSKKEKKRKKNT